MINFIYNLISKFFKRNSNHITNNLPRISYNTLSKLINIATNTDPVPKNNKILITSNGYEILFVMNTYHNILHKKVKGSLCYMKVIDEDSHCNSCELLSNSFKDNPYKCKYCKKCEHSNNGFAHTYYRYRYLNVDDIISAMNENY